jgi:hypothetical protein
MSYRKVGREGRRTLGGSSLQSSELRVILVGRPQGEPERLRRATHHAGEFAERLLSAVAAAGP